MPKPSTPITQYIVGVIWYQSYSQHFQMSRTKQLTMRFLCRVCDDLLFLLRHSSGMKDDFESNHTVRPSSRRKKIHQKALLIQNPDWPSTKTHEGKKNLKLNYVQTMLSRWNQKMVLHKQDRPKHELRQIREKKPLSYCELSICLWNPLQ